MNQIILSTLLLLSSLANFAQTLSNHDIKYKPKTLDEAVIQLTRIHDDSTKNSIKLMTEDEFLGRAHMSLGMWMRNNWGLWKGSDLSNYFHNIGIFHPDDMSGIVLTSYHRTLNNKDIDLNGQVKYYQDYWKASNEHIYKLKTDTSYQRQIKNRNDSLTLLELENKIIDWPVGTAVSGYVKYRRRLFDLGNLTKVKGIVVSWSENKMTIRITEYVDKSRKKSVIRCNDIHDDVLTVSNIDFFQKEE